MKKLKALIKKYRFFLIISFTIVIITFINENIGFRALSISAHQLGQMLLVVPPIFVLLGLLDVWVPKETMVKYMGDGSGVKGAVLAFIIGSAAAGPLYGAFPVAAVFMKKGVKLFNLLIFIGAWSTTKIPMFLFEMASLGVKFAVTRLIIDIPGIILISFALSKLMPRDEINKIYENAENLD